MWCWFTKTDLSEIYITPQEISISIDNHYLLVLYLKYVQFRDYLIEKTVFMVLKGA